jgi:putative aldouronate transport system permease protein
VSFWPKGFTFYNYQIAFKNPRIWSGFFWSIARVVVGTVISLLLTLLTAYPMSRDKKTFPMRNVFVVIMLFAMLFNGGLVAFFIVIQQMGLYNSFLSLVLPGAVNIWNVILMMNFFRGLPKELEEAALIDGATHWDVLFRIYIPISTPAIATITLFVAVGLWNDWFMPLLLIRDPAQYPLQTYLQNFLNVSNIEQLFRQGNLTLFLNLISDRGLRAATLMIATIPIMVIYPFLQRYFVKGIVLGAVKE